MVIFWPIHLSTEGYAYGWRRPLTCVAGVLPSDSLAEAQERLADAIAGNAWETLRQDLQLCPPMILGRCHFPGASESAGQHSIDEPCLYPCHQAAAQTHNCCGTSIVYYRPLNRSAMRFYSLDSRELNILPSQNMTDSTGPRLSQIKSIFDCDFTCPPWKAYAMFDPTVLSNINVAQPLQELVENTSSVRSKLLPSPYVPPTLRREPSTSASFASNNSLRTLRRLTRALRELSTTVEQLDVRCEQAAFVLSQAATIYRSNKSRSVKFISRYVKFYNCIWLVLNDMIIGLAFGSFLCENRDVLGKLLDDFALRYLVESMQRALVWLNSWPAGLKLNTELSQFYCYTLLAVISIWARVLQNIGPYYPALFWTVGAMGYCGMTMIVALLSDVMSLLTVHLYLCYVLSATAFSTQLSLAGSLWNLFRGKRFNVLRNRLDSWDYDIDQLLLGTILFTLVAFLYPTVLTYYALFATTHVLMIMLHGMLDTISALLNHFPLFALMLRIKDPMRLPGHVVFRRLPPPAESLILENQPMPLSSIFTHYADLWARLSSHYHPLRLLRLLTSGRILTLIARSSVRFSMIPTDTHLSASHPK